jgi:hydroxymethylbilane synthase
MTPIRLGTRGSPLAIIQAQEARDRLMAAHAELRAPGAVEIVPITTAGDKVQDRALAEVGGKGLFTKEIERWLIDGRIDMAVHSMKDVPTHLGDEFALPCILPRADPRDALLGAASIAALPKGAVVGSASTRRQAQLLHARPDLKVVLFRGNVNTRLRKLNEGVAAATVLARAGLDRLNMADVGATLAPEEMLPSAAQGAIGIQIRADDSRARGFLVAIDHASSHAEVACERALLASLDGSCRTPIGALAELSGDRLRLRALVARPDGTGLWRAERTGARGAAEAMGRDAGEELRRQADARIFEGPR